MLLRRRGGGVGIAGLQRIEQPAMVQQRLFEHARLLPCALADFQSEEIEPFANALQDGVPGAAPDGLMKLEVGDPEGVGVVDRRPLIGENGLQAVKPRLIDVDGRAPRDVALDQPARIVEFADVDLVQRKVELQRELRGSRARGR